MTDVEINLLQEYPNCDKLPFNIASLLDGGRTMFGMADYELAVYQKYRFELHTKTVV